MWRAGHRRPIADLWVLVIHDRRDTDGQRGGRAQQPQNPKRTEEEERWREERKIVDEARMRRAYTTSDDGAVQWKREWDREKGGSGSKAKGMSEYGS